MSSVATAPILVTGATGRQGGTGRHAAAALLDRGLAVRALVRTLDERAEYRVHWLDAGRYRAAHGAGSRRANPAWCAAR